MIDKNDWRLTNQMDYLFKKFLLHILYQPYRIGWEHDHCEFCFKLIDTSSKIAYCTTDQYYWICEECYNDFKDLFQWNIIS
jgi:hypothetical protein